MTTIRNVAKDANVSIATVSRVINNSSAVKEEVRARVLESINRCGYVPAVGRRVTSYVGLAYLGVFSLGSPYDVALLEGMADAMGECDLDIVVLNLQRDKRVNETFTQLFLRKGVRGVILRASELERGLCEAIADEGFPSIVVGERIENPLVNFVGCDSRRASQQAVEHLIDLGHRRIALAVHEVEDTDHRDRLEAYHQSHAEHGIEPDPRLLFRIPARRPDGAQLVRNMMSMAKPPTALFITDQLVAVGAINEAHRLGVRIPEELSIVGFDDADIRGNVFPMMTAVCQDARLLGYEALLAIAQLTSDNGREVPVRVTTAAWLELNGTTAEPPKKPIRILPGGKRVEASG